MIGCLLDGRVPVGRHRVSITYYALMWYISVTGLVAAAAVIVVLVLREMVIPCFRFVDQRYPTNDKSSIPNFVPWGHRGQGVNVKLNGSILQLLTVDDEKVSIIREVLLDFQTLSTTDKEELETQFREYGFNKFVSDRIPLRRSLDDLRPLHCRSVPDSSLDAGIRVSVVIVFHNEAWSTFMRTVYSILHRTTDRLIHELILLDNASTEHRYKYPILENYLSTIKKVKIVRCPIRLSLRESSRLGASLSTGDDVIFLQSKCEVYHGYQYVDDQRGNLSDSINVIDSKMLHENKNSQNILASTREEFELSDNLIFAGTKSFILELFSTEDTNTNVPFRTHGNPDMEKIILATEISLKAKQRGATISTVPCSHVGLVTTISI